MGQESTNSDGAVACLARRVHNILSNGRSNAQPICEVMVKGKGTTISRQGIVSIGKKGATDLNLRQRSIDPDLLGSILLGQGLPWRLSSNIMLIF